jgi:hypothetical protein
VSDGVFQKVLRKSSALDSPGSLVGWLGWERLRHRGPCPAPVPEKAGQGLSPLLRWFKKRVSKQSESHFYPLFVCTKYRFTSAI